MPARKRKPAAPKTLFVGVKESCNNIGENLYTSVAAAAKSIKDNNDYELVLEEPGDSVIIYELFPVYRITMGGYTETELF
jgi:hypothetical protein